MDLIFPKKIRDTEKALKTLELAVNSDHLKPIEKRDIMVLRFLYTSELFGKIIKLYLREKEKIEVKFTADGYRKARGIGFIVSRRN